MVCKPEPINLINEKSEETYDTMVWLFMTVRQASVFDANIFCHRISPLIQLINWNVPHPEHLDRWQMIFTEQNFALECYSPESIQTRYMFRQ